MNAAGADSQPRMPIDNKPAADKPTVLLFEADNSLQKYYGDNFHTLSLAEGELGFHIVDPLSGGLIKHLPSATIALIVAQQCVSKYPGIMVALNDFLCIAGAGIPIITHHNGLELSLAIVADYQLRSARQVAQLMTQLASLRQVHEELQNGYDALRALVYENGMSLPHASFVNIPDTDELTTSATFHDIVQPMPVEMRLLCGISLHIGGVPHNIGCGEIEAELFSPDDDTIKITWRFSSRQASRGWITFAFEQKGMYLRRNLAIRLTNKAADGAGPEFSLGSTQLRPDKVAIVDGQPVSRSLALKAWVSVPGAPLNLSTQMWPVVRLDSKPVTLLNLAINEAEIVDFRSLNQAANFSPVQRLGQRPRIIVHPLGNQPTIAQIVGACPAGTSEVWAEVETDNEKAGMVEYGITLLPKKLPQPPSNDDIETIAASIDWTKLPAKTCGLLSLVVDVPLTEPSDLGLLTRVPPGAHSDACWATYKRIYFKGIFS